MSPFFDQKSVVGLVLLLGGLVLPAAHAEDKPSPEGLALFEKKIRPVLVAECYACHGSEKGNKARGGLVLDSRAGLRRGGDSGPALVPGKPKESLLLRALSHADKKLAMPPRKKLDESVRRDFEQWILLGAPDPREANPVTSKYVVDFEKGRRHWAYQPVGKVAPPPVKNTGWPTSEVDRFIMAGLEARGLTAMPDADRRTLLRRLAFDLTGLPPTPQEMEAFLGDETPRAYEKMVDQYLGSPRFGEKWARHWLDVARYAESTGKTVNFAFPHAWRYRDYVIASFNADKPFDRFIQEQLAGDLMPSDDPKVELERRVATGFLAIGPKTLNERNGLKFELDIVDEQIDVTTQAFLGITVACARCHDHKFDPITQKDYYALAGIFRSTETCYGTVRYINAQRPGALLPLPREANPAVGVERQTEAERRRVENQIKQVRDSMRSGRDGLQRFFASGTLSLLQARLDAFDEEGHPKLLAMGVRDRPVRAERGTSRGGFPGYTYDGSRAIADSHLFVRGEADQPSSQRVPRGTLEVLAKTPLTIPATSSGRLELAGWIASKENPLTARVLVNRVWLQLFGRGLVPTADDFGLMGRPPTHPELLDHLAQQCMGAGWSLKNLIRYLVLSRVYRLASMSSPQSLELDPDNTLLWRMTPRRLDAECLRDAVLAVSEQLDLTPPVGSVVARAGEGPVSRFGPGGAAITPAINDVRNLHRSIYLPLIRDSLPEALMLFDGADPNLITSDRAQTTVPSQGLYLMNSPFVLRAADAAAARLLAEDRPEAERMQAAYLRIWGRPPSSREQASAQRFLVAYRAHLGSSDLSATRRDQEAWSAFCQALFATAEFQYRK
ncbi:MAG: PSD1 and planctomycete cytochrome C domain-containing protein [Gemmataceae bacterium]